MEAEGEEEGIKGATTSQTTIQEEAVVAVVHTGISRIMGAEAEGGAEAIGAMIKEVCSSSVHITKHECYSRSMWPW